MIPRFLTSKTGRLAAFLLAALAAPAFAQQFRPPGQPVQPPVLQPVPGQPPRLLPPPGQPPQLQAPAQRQMQALPAIPSPPANTRLSNPVAVFAGLDKITGRIISFDVYVDETVQFGALQVTPRVCYTRPPTESPLTDAFVEVDEITLNRKVQRLFTGWMFASSPGLHAVDHAVYDVWLTDCRMKSDVAPPKR